MGLLTPASFSDSPPRFGGGKRASGSEVLSDAPPSSSSQSHSSFKFRMPVFGWDSRDSQDNTKNGHDSHREKDSAGTHQESHSENKESKPVLSPSLQPRTPPSDQQSGSPAHSGDDKEINQHQSRVEHKDRQPSDQSDLVIDPALRNESALPSSTSSDKKDNSLPSLVNHISEDSKRNNHSDHPMPHRVLESTFPSMSTSYVMSSPPQEHSRFTPYYRHRRFENTRLPSPPPIATMPHSHSPSPSVASADRSSVSTPPVRRSPPQHSMPLYPSSYQTDPSMMRSNHHPTHFAPPPPREHINLGGYVYHPHPGFDHHRPYEHPDSTNHSPYHPPAGLPHFVPAMTGYPRPVDAYGHPYPLPGQAPAAIVHTDDAATKLSDRVRRRCFNCCTTDTSTWRRSNLSPGKVLCNKCGLFERTHSRPRPEQFPHKRGPLATSNIQRRTPPMPTQLPPIAAPPYHYTHPSVAPLNQDRREYQQQPQQQQQQSQQGNTLPALQSWHADPPTSSGSPHIAPAPTARRSTLDSSRGSPPLVSAPVMSRSGNSSQDSSREVPPATAPARDAA
ncbi:hypothetical protein BDQ12DRAFT_712286 [Crucibulum laeve]|uniref:GATA-type domain-containing protein n=1 Tax=Crucibulum laeve TaxID=68775 RepID=A0A5C3M719_9AGAR|nr:hypothetical protein BDQ12DRAFT_712286 [Crucibulum laeve]